MGKRLISNLFGLAQNEPLQVWTYRLKEKEPASNKHIKSLLNSACWRLIHKYKEPFFYEGVTIVSLIDIGDGFEDNYCILERESFNPDYFLSGQEAWRTFIKGCANLLMMKREGVESVLPGIERKYILGTEFINERVYLSIDFEYMLFSTEDLDRQLAKGEEPEIGGEYYVPTHTFNKSIAILKEYEKVSVEEYEDLMEQMLRVSSEETRAKWEEGLKRVRWRGYGYIAKVVFNENDERKYTYPANALVKVRRVEDLNPKELELIRPSPAERWRIIAGFRSVVERLLKKYSISLDVEPYREIVRVNPEIFKVVDGRGEIYTIYGSAKTVLNSSSWSPIIRNPRISVGFLYLYTKESSLRDLENRVRIIENTVLERVSSFGLHIDRIEPIRVSLYEYKERPSLLLYIGNLEGSNCFLFVLTDASKLDDELYLDIKRDLLGFGIQSQVIYSRTDVEDGNVADNLMLGLLGKTGNYPYFLKDSSNKVFVGIDLSRKVRSSNKGTLNAVGTAIIVDANGGTITYKNINVPAGGEAVEKAYVKSLANMLYKYKDKFIVIHRDGNMSMDEFNAYMEIFSKLLGPKKFALVSILKSGTPRIFQMKGNIVENPSKGCAILLSEQEAVISTYKPSRGTHIPLRIKVLYGAYDYPLNEAIEDVLKLTLLNFSSFTLNKLPATVAFADRIAWFNLHGIAPEDADGNLFFL